MEKKTRWANFQSRFLQCYFDRHVYLDFYFDFSSISFTDKHKGSHLAGPSTSKRGFGLCRLFAGVEYDPSLSNPRDRALLVSDHI